MKALKHALNRGRYGVASSHAQRGISRLGLGLALCAVALLPLHSPAGTRTYTLYETKALFLFNFAKYTEWPKETFPNDNAPFVIGILGQDPFGNDINIIKDKTIKGRKVAVKYPANVREAAECQLLFISNSEAGNLQQILKALENSSVLTITEIEGPTQPGGMINLVAEQKSSGMQTIAFEIDKAASERANLKFDTQLLRLAKKVS